MIKTFDDGDLTPGQLLALEQLSERRAQLSCLADVFDDPMDAFLHSPTPLNVRDLVSIYAPKSSRDDSGVLAATLRRRMRDERWVEARSVVQSRRMSARREALIQCEAEVWVSLGLEFSARKIRSKYERYLVLDEYVEACLSDLVDTDGATFDPHIRDAMSALSKLEEELTQLMPAPDFHGRAAEFWSKKAGDRKALIAQIKDRLAVADGADQAGAVFRLIQGGNTPDEEGGG